LVAVHGEVYITKDGTYWEEEIEEIKPSNTKNKAYVLRGQSAGMRETEEAREVRELLYAMLRLLKNEADKHDV